MNRSQDYHKRAGAFGAGGIRKVPDHPNRIYEGDSGSQEMVNFDNHSNTFNGSNRPNVDMLFRPRRSFLKRGDRKKAMAANMILNVNKKQAYDTQLSLD